MINKSSLNTVADQLRISPIDVTNLHRRGLLQLRARLERDPDLFRQVRNASRQPRRARRSR
jgi:hypothetical protein